VGVHRAHGSDRVSVVELLELEQRVEQVPLFQIKVRSDSSRRHVCTQRSTSEFIRGI
jgi:hypothetical protein